MGKIRVEVVMVDIVRVEIDSIQDPLTDLFLMSMFIKLSILDHIVITRLLQLWLMPPF